jgi:Ca-activated chloride channel homolog
MFRLGNPIFLLLLIPLALAAWRVYGRRRRDGIRFAPLHRLATDRPSWRAAVGALMPGLALAALVPGILALARPQTVLSTARRTSDVIAIEMAVDISGSMEALDLSTRTPTGNAYRTRLDVVKETFADFVKQRPVDLIGLVAFGGYASSLVPLTTDHDALLHVLAGVKTPQPAFGQDGAILNQEELLTAIGDGLATACARLRNADVKSRIVVLLSDGESNAGVITPNQAIETAKALGIRVYTIGVGSTGRAPFWGSDRYGRKSISYAHVSLDETQLKRIAEATGGRYYNVRGASSLKEAFEDIDTLEKTRIEQAVYYQFNELFPWLAVPSLALLALAITLNMGLNRRMT